MTAFSAHVEETALSRSGREPMQVHSREAQRVKRPALPETLPPQAAGIEGGR